MDVVSFNEITHFLIVKSEKLKKVEIRKKAKKAVRCHYQRLWVEDMVFANWQSYLSLSSTSLIIPTTRVTVPTLNYIQIFQTFFFYKKSLRKKKINLLLFIN